MSFEDYKVRCLAAAHIVRYFMDLGVESDTIFQGVKVDYAYVMNPNNWIALDDYYQLADNCQAALPHLTIYDWENIGFQVRRGEATDLFRVTISLLGLQSIFSRVQTHVRRMNNYSRLEVVSLKNGFSDFISHLEPDVLAVNTGTFLPWTTGALAAVAAICTHYNPRTRILYDQALLENVVTGMYRYHGLTYREKNDTVYIGDEPVARRIALIPQQINEREVLGVAYTLDRPFNAILMERDIESRGKILLRKGDIFNAPYGRLQIYWEHRKILARIYNLLWSQNPFGRRVTRHFEQQIELAERRYFESERLRLAEQKTKNQLKKVNEILKNKIRELKQSEDEKRRLESLLLHTQKMESMGSFAGGIAHDFNNILYPIIGYAEMTMDDVPPQSLAHQNLQEILQSAHRAKELVQQILAFSRQGEGEFNRIKVQPVVKECLRLLRSTIPSQIEIEMDIDPQCGSILGNRVQIHQVIMNLGANAYHAMEEVSDGRLKVSLREIQILPGDSRLSANITPGRYAFLSISDTGHGIPAHILERIFDPYFTTKAPGKGTGLGLAVTHGIIKSHGGDIAIQSREGEGTTVNIYFPVIEDKESCDERPSPEKLKGGKERVMVVDDEIPVVQMVRLMMEKLGYRVSTYTSSSEALESFRENPEKYDLVITDLSMPHLTGIELVKEIRAVRDDIPVILSSGYSDRISDEKASQLEIQAFIKKPIIRDELAQTIRTVLDDAGQGLSNPSESS